MSKAMEAAARALLVSESASGLEWEKLDAITRGSFKRDAQAAVTAYLAAMEAEGPTEAQIQAGMAVPCEDPVTGGMVYSSRAEVTAIYRAMLAASPTEG